MKKRVLIVEDKLWRKIALQRLFSSKYEITCLDDGLEALNWLKKGNVADLIVTDEDLPHLSGLQLMQQLASIPFFMPLPVILINNEKDEIQIKTTLFDKTKKLQELPYQVDYFLADRRVA